MLDSLLWDLLSSLRNFEEFSVDFQKKIAEAKFLAELFNSGMTSSRTIFQVLYALLFHARFADPPREWNRLRLVLTILDTCTPFLPQKGKIAIRLDRFLLYLQRYVISKGAMLPVDVDYQLADLFEQLRPALTWPSTPEEASDRIREFEANHFEIAGTTTTGGAVKKPQIPLLPPVELEMPGNERLYAISKLSEQELALMASQTTSSTHLDEDDEDDEAEMRRDARDEEAGREYESSSSGSDSDSESGSGVDAADKATRKDGQTTIDPDYDRADASYKRALAQEALELDREFQRLLDESVSQRKNEKPVGVKSLKTASALVAQRAPSSAASARSGSESVKFRIIVGKRRIRTIDVPKASPLAAAVEHRQRFQMQLQNDIKDDEEHLKQKTLASAQAQIEEAAAEERAARRGGWRGRYQSGFHGASRGGGDSAEPRRGRGRGNVTWAPWTPDPQPSQQPSTSTRVT